mmetsp:Transcript_120205/g.208711  ORF Transcript_120205/g.208711 Transcript_120205/m.208711 type:complete len:349 (+) Transcript_120205:57-1103(+)
MSILTGISIVLSLAAVEGTSSQCVDSQGPEDSHVSLLQSSLEFSSRKKITPSAVPASLLDVSRWEVPEPISAAVPPGLCVLGETWTAAPILSKESISENTRVFKFGLGNHSQALNLCTCCSMMMRGGNSTSLARPIDKLTGEPLAHPYGIVSTNAMLGGFEMMIKIYSDGRLTSYLDQLAVGESMEFAHFPENVRIQYPFNVDEIGMIAGGTGIVPMLQAMQSMLGTIAEKTKITLLYASSTKEDILAKEVLDTWYKLYPDRLRVVHFLSQEPFGSDWAGFRGHINMTHLQAFLPAPDSSCIIFICGPGGNSEQESMYDTYSGPRLEDDEVKGMLGWMGYNETQVYKF